MVYFITMLMSPLGLKSHTPFYIYSLFSPPPGPGFCAHFGAGKANPSLFGARGFIRADLLKFGL